MWGAQYHLDITCILTQLELLIRYVSRFAVSVTQCCGYLG
jgi:hypothetical protein